MSFGEHLCRSYQRLFSPDHEAEGDLRRLHREGVRSGNLEDFYATYFDQEYAKGRAVVERFSGMTTEWIGGRALDFGAGGGGVTCRISESTSEVVGIDVQRRLLDFARAEASKRGYTGATFVHYDGRAPIDLPAGSFDVIFCIDVVEHLPALEIFLAEFRRLLRPGGLLLLSFGPPWGHAHGKHMWTSLPGWWTHLIFPRRTVMRVIGRPADTTYEDLGIFRLTVEKYERAMRRSGFRTVREEHGIRRGLGALKHVPGLRSLFISEVVGVYRSDPSVTGETH